MEFFAFEQDFVEEGIRCIPMVVRLKLDTVGIKLTLRQWARIGETDRAQLSALPCVTPGHRAVYRAYLQKLIARATGEEAKPLPIDDHPAWLDVGTVPEMVNKRAEEFSWRVETAHWQRLTILQRFALIKLCRPGHENKNFPMAMVEFGLAPPGPPGC